MKTILVISTALVPVLMYYVTTISKHIQNAFNVIAVIALVLFGMITSTAVYQVIIDQAVFSTAIHSIFLNPYFLITGAFLGAYFIYRLLVLTMEGR